jgi:hypothetical protein
MCTFALPAIKDISNGQCPVIAWLSASLSYYLHLLGPEHLGGQGDLAAKIEVAAKESGKTPKEVANSVRLIIFAIIHSREGQHSIQE